MDSKAKAKAEFSTGNSGNPNFDRFTEAMKRIITVPYSKIKATLDEENKVRSRKRTRKSKYAAFRDANKTD